MYEQKGLSLIELMIAIALGMVLMLGVMQMFLSSRQVFATQQALSRIQETGRLAMEFMAKDIRMAGYMGCMTRTSGAAITNTLNNATNFDTNFGVAIQGFTAATVPAGALATATPTAATDIVVVRGAFGGGAQLSGSNHNASAQLFVTQTSFEAGGCTGGTPRVSGMCEGDIVVVADCAKARVFQITNLQSTGSGGTTVNAVHSNSGTVSPGNAISSWGGASAPDSELFDAGADIMTASSITYFIAPGASGFLPSLWQRSGLTQPIELLEGVENMSLRYGLDNDGDFIPDGNYLNAADVTAVGGWARVLSVRIELLIASIEPNVLADPQPYVFAGAPATAAAVADRRLRMVFSNTIGIRSRLP